MTRALQARVDAVEEIKTKTHADLITLPTVLSKLPDLAKGLSRIQYGQVSPLLLNPKSQQYLLSDKKRC